jgi:hypothetical protein
MSEDPAVVAAKMATARHDRTLRENEGLAANSNSRQPEPSTAEHAAEIPLPPVPSEHST